MLTFFSPDIAFRLCAFDRNMVLAERCALLSTEILKSQGKYSEAATLLIKMTSEVRESFSFVCLKIPQVHCKINSTFMNIGTHLYDTPVVLIYKTKTVLHLLII